MGLGRRPERLAHRWYGVTPTEHHGDLAVTVRFVTDVKLGLALEIGLRAAEHNGTTGAKRGVRVLTLVAGRSWVGL